MNAIFSHTGVEPKEWLILFHRTSTPWVSRVCWGEFKHCSALAKVPDAHAWVSLSWELGRMRVSLIAEGEDFERWFALASADAAILSMPAPAFEHGPWRPRLGLTCVSAVKHLLGVRGWAIRPDQLFKDCLKNGAVILGEPAGRSSAAAGSDHPSLCGGPNGYFPNMQS